MASTDPIAALREIIDQLNEILLGGEDDTVTIDGVTKPSITKAIQDHFEEIEAIANGSMGYATLAELQAAGAPASEVAGTLAQVTNDNDPLSNGLYRWDGAAWVQSSYDRYTAIDNRIAQLIDDLGQTLVAAAESSEGENVAFAITDALGKAALIIDQDGGAQLPGGLAGLKHQETDIADPTILWAIMDAVGRAAITVHNDGSASVSGMKIEAFDSGFAFMMVDSQGRISWAIDANGRFVNFEDPEEPEEEASAGPVLESLANVQTDFMMGTSYGQSLSIGTNAYPPISTTQPYFNVMFASGVTPSDPDSTLNPIDYNSFVPLIEERDSSVHGETPVSGTLNGLVKRIVARGGNEAEWQFVGNAPGRGGTRISALVKGSANYGWMLNQWQAAHDLAQAQGKSFSVWHMTWTQGEEDYDQDTSYEVYLAHFLALAESIGPDAAAITGQSFHPPTVVYQSGSNHDYGRDHINIARAQWQASRQSDNIIMACPVYPIPPRPNDVHLTADSSFMLGQYYARALDYSLLQGNGSKWRPLEPKSVIWSGTVIDIALHVPYGPVILDTTLVAQAPNQGFDIFEGDAIADIINSVQVVGGNRIRIALSREAAEGAVVSYARGRPGDSADSGPLLGPRGNIRDSHGDLDFYTNSEGDTVRLHNWLVVFEYQLGSGAL